MKKNLHMLPPKGASAFFSPAADESFRRAHPTGYLFLVALGITALCGPGILLTVIIACSQRLDNAGAWPFVGWIGAFIVGIGLFNLVAIIIRQYLGHLLTILCFLIGGGLVGLSLAFLL